ncbi:MAG: hypothetical protein NTW96_08215 [Planctomycetia bacterium]|nr:hypothetical protein [Planctomycetia bacterium]
MTPLEVGMGQQHPETRVVALAQLGIDQPRELVDHHAQPGIVLDPAGIEDQQFQLGLAVADLLEDVAQRIAAGDVLAAEEKIAAQQVGLAVVGNAVRAEVEDQRVARPGDDSRQPVAQEHHVFGRLDVAQQRDVGVAGTGVAKAGDVLVLKPDGRHGPDAVVADGKTGEMDSRMEQDREEQPGQHGHQAQQQNRQHDPRRFLRLVGRSNIGAPPPTPGRQATGTL